MREAESSLLSNWSEILRTQNLSPGRSVDAISRWLLITRASVFPMTLISGAIGGLLAVGSHTASWSCFALAMIGLVVAHAANNMINDYFDLEGGVDTQGYARTVYAPHPILSGLTDPRGLLLAIAICNAADLAILAWLMSVRGPVVGIFALLGLAISVFYVAPPIRLKHHGLGEPGVFVVWGPLMIGGTYYATTGEISGGVVCASLPYAMLVTAVLLGKHIDKLDADRAKGIRTMPVLLGRAGALRLARVLFGGFYVAVLGLVAAGILAIPCLIVLFSIPFLRETLGVFRHPAPSKAPEGYPIWPLWYVAWAFRLTRRAGSLFLIGLAGQAIFAIVR
jgi:1,4-dihydroxy-2-naphthoate octaprenyltransferase